MAPGEVALVSAFWGAFLGMIAFQVNEALSRTRRRQRDHHTALVKLERGLNRQLESIGTNIDLTRGLIASTQAGTRSINMPHQVAGHGAPDIDLMEPILINELLNLETAIGRLNWDLDAVGAAYRMLWEFRMANPDRQTDFKEALADYVGYYQQLLRHMVETQLSVQMTFARVRVECPRDKPSGFVFKTWAHAATEAEVQAEHAEFLRELSGPQDAKTIADSLARYRARWNPSLLARIRRMVLRKPKP
jgi:hypothetical protein